MASPTPQPPYLEALNEIVQEGVATVQQLARAAGCTPQHMRNAINQCYDKGLSLGAFQKVSAWLVDEKGEVRQLEAFLGVKGGAYLRPDQVELDQCIEEEAHDLLKEVTYTEDAIDEEETGAARRHAAKVRGLAELIIEEVEAMREMHESALNGQISITR